MRARAWGLSILITACSSPASAPTSTTAPPPSASATTAAPSPTAPGASVAPPTTVAATVAPRVRAEGFDVRATFWSQPLFVLSRSPAGEASGQGEPLGDDTEMDTLVRWVLGPASSDPVRVVSETGVCDGTLGRRVRIEAPWLDVGSPDRAAIGHEVDGCPGPALFAIVHPTPGAPWPIAVAVEDARAAPALSAARAALSAITPGASAGDLEARAYRLDDVIYGVAWARGCGASDEDDCPAGGGALVALAPGAEPRTLIVRPAHSPWGETMRASYASCGVTDVDGDGAVELCEQLTSDIGSTLLRLVRPAERRAGEMIWSVEEVAEQSLPQGGATPPPVQAVPASEMAPPR